MNDDFSFYDTMKQYHKQYQPSLRFGQILIKFNHWHINRYGKDILQVQNKELVHRFKEFLINYK